MELIPDTTKLAKNLRVDRSWAKGENLLLLTLLKEHKNQMTLMVCYYDH